MGQSKSGDVQGYVKDVNNQPVISASVYLLKTIDSAVVKVTITNKDGLFTFADVKPGNYLINVTAVGYNTKMSARLSMGTDLNLDVGIIQLKTSTTNIKEIAILANKSFVEIKADRVILNMQNSMLSVGNNALEVLKTAPGVKVDNNNGISLNGRSDVQVTIDNKPTYLSSSALADLLQGTQSSMIDRIELIANPNASYDANGTGGVINIKLKRDKTLGTNVQFTSTAGVVQPGQRYGSEFKGGTGLNFNSRTKKLNVFGGYTYTNVPNNISSMSERQIVYNGQAETVNVNWFIDQRKESHNFRLGADYSINANHTLGFAVSGIITAVDGPKKTMSSVASLGKIDSTITTNSTLKKAIANISYDVNYRANFNKAGELTFDADYIDYRRNYNEAFESNYFKPVSTTAYRNLWLQNNSPSNYDMYVLNLGYHIDIDKDNSFLAGAKWSYVKADNTSNFDSVVNKTNIPLAKFTGKFRYTEEVNAAFADYTHAFSKQTSIELGLRIEQTVSEAVSTTSTVSEDYKNDYYGLFPSVQFSHIINADNQLSLAYSRKISRPKYEDLSPLLIYTDQYSYQLGNPYLKPFYANVLTLKHIYKEKFTTLLSFSETNGFIQSVYKQQSSQSQGTTLQKINLGNRYVYGIEIFGPARFTRWYNAEFDLSGSYQQYTGTSASGNINSGSPDIDLKVTQHFKLPLGLKADIYGEYETPTTFGVFRYKANYFFNVAVGTSILDKKANIQLQANNIFNTNKDIITSNYLGQNISETHITNFRIIQLSFTYSLGSQSIKAARKHTNGAEEEQGRVGNN